MQLLLFFLPLLVYLAGASPIENVAPRASPCSITGCQDCSTATVTYTAYTYILGRKVGTRTTKEFEWCAACGGDYDLQCFKPKGDTAAVITFPGGSISKLEYCFCVPKICGDKGMYGSQCQSLPVDKYTSYVNGDNQCLGSSTCTTADAGSLGAGLAQGFTFYWPLPPIPLLASGIFDMPVTNGKLTVGTGTCFIPYKKPTPTDPAVCRVADPNNPCDKADTCDGQSAHCVADAFWPDGTEGLCTRPVDADDEASGCDVADTCRQVDPQGDPKGKTVCTFGGRADGVACGEKSTNLCEETAHTCKTVTTLKGTVAHTCTGPPMYKAAHFDDDGHLVGTDSNPIVCRTVADAECDQAENCAAVTDNTGAILSLYCPADLPRADKYTGAPCLANNDLTDCIDYAGKCQLSGSKWTCSTDAPNDVTVSPTTHTCNTVTLQASNGQSLCFPIHCDGTNPKCPQIESATANNMLKCPCQGSAQLVPSLCSDGQCTGP